MKSPASRSGDTDTAKSGPYFLLITTDQQRFDTIRCLGNEHIDTPHLDWLADERVVFSRAHVDAPMCVPSRATIMTGLGGASMGQTDMSPEVMPLRNHPTLPGVLTEAGSRNPNERP